jgi:hypothetical protein
LQAHRELLLRRREVLDAGERVLVSLRLRKGQIDIVRPGLEVVEVDAILDQLVGSFVEVEEFIHLLDGRHSSELKGVGRMRQASSRGTTHSTVVGVGWKIKGKA